MTKIEPLNGQLSGWLILDKPLGMSSAQAVGRVKRLLKPRKVGHGGTLDPLASGILPLALNEATKAFQFVAANTKTYRFTVEWGVETSTDDREGEVTQRSDKRPSREEILAVLSRFTGDILQAPPVFSAIKVDGERAYALARNGENVELAERPVKIEELRLLAMADAGHAEFEMRCGKGTYVRSIARDLGRALGCYGHVAALRRTAVGNFDEKGAISLEKLEVLVHSGALKERLLPVSSVLADIPALELDPEAARRLRQGQSVSVSCQEGKMVQVLDAGVLVAVATVNDQRLRPVRVFNLESDR